MTEQWRPVPGYPHYSVSNTGIVRSLRSGREMKQASRGASSPRVPYLRVHLRAPGRKWSADVHRLVLLAFVGEPPAGKRYACHIDGDPLHNDLSNLYWGSQKDNSDDMVRHGRAHWQTRTHCPQGHEYTEDNTSHRRDKRGWNYRLCLTCNRAAQRRYAAKQKGYAA